MQIRAMLDQLTVLLTGMVARQTAEWSTSTMRSAARARKGTVSGPWWIGRPPSWRVRGRGRGSDRIEEGDVGGSAPASVPPNARRRRNRREIRRVRAPRTDRVTSRSPRRWYLRGASTCRPSILRAGQEPSRTGSPAQRGLYSPTLPRSITRRCSRLDGEAGIHFSLVDLLQHGRIEAKARKERGVKGRGAVEYPLLALLMLLDDQAVIAQGEVTMRQGARTEPPAGEMGLGRGLLVAADLGKVAEPPRRQSKAIPGLPLALRLTLDQDPLGPRAFDPVGDAILGLGRRDPAAWHDASRATTAPTSSTLGGGLPHVTQRSSRRSSGPRRPRWRRGRRFWKSPMWSSSRRGERRICVA